MNIAEFCNNLGSTQPTPGGGAAAGYSLAMGASCAEKAARFSINDKIDDYINSFISLKNSGIKLAEEDQYYFQKWQDSRKLHKDTDEQKKIRSAQINEAVEGCAITPYKICCEADKMLQIIDEFLPFCNNMLISDVAVGVSMAGAAYESSIFNIIINLPYIKNKETSVMLQTFLDNSIADFEEKKDLLLSKCKDMLTPN